MRGDFCGMGKCRDFSKHFCEALSVLRGSAFRFVSFQFSWKIESAKFLYCQAALTNDRTQCASAEFGMIRHRNGNGTTRDRPLHDHVASTLAQHLESMAFQHPAYFLPRQHRQFRQPVPPSRKYRTRWPSAGALPHWKRIQRTIPPLPSDSLWLPLL